MKIMYPAPIKYLLLLAVAGFLLTSPSFASTIVCDGDAACRGDTLTCIAGEDCTLACTGGRACSEGTVNAPVGYQLDVGCNGWDGCRDLTIQGEAAVKVGLGCGVNQACQGLILNAPINGDVSVRHDSSTHVLAWSILKAAQAARVEDIECTANANCLGMQFWLPTSNVVVRCTGQNACNRAVFYMPGDGANLSLTCDNSNDTACLDVTARCGEDYTTTDTIQYNDENRWVWGGTCNIDEILADGFE